MRKYPGKLETMEAQIRKLFCVTDQLRRRLDAVEKADASCAANQLTLNIEVSLPKV